MDGFNEIGKYLKKIQDQANFALKRPRVPTVAVEKIRDIFDVEYPFEAKVNTPPNTETVFLSLNFGKRLPSLSCCGDCFCGSTEAYTSDSLIGGDLYVFNAYVPNSTFVYLDGELATRGVEYLESDPTNKKLTILIPFTSIIISYNYSTGNCTENQECIDTFPCPDFGLFSGLVTVFADRFDVGRLSGTGETVGGCGMWASGINSSTGIPIPANAFGGFIGNRIAAIGGRARVSGKSLEIVASLREGSDFTASPFNIDYSVSMSAVATSSTNLRLTLSASARYRYLEAPSYTSVGIGDSQFSLIQNFAITSEFIAAPKMVRAAQYPNGNLFISIWEEGAEESSGHSMTLTLSDFTVPTLGFGNTLLDYRMIVPTFYGVSFTNTTVKAIKIGAGLDTGDWGVNLGAVGGAFFNHCFVIPDYEPGKPYFGDCDVESYTVSATTDTVADYHVAISFPVVIGSDPPGGTGRVAEITHRVATVDCLPGHPSAVRVKGMLRASFATNIVVNAIFESFSGTAVPSYYSDGFVGGSPVGSYTLTTNQTPVPFDILIPYTDGVARWSVRIPSPESIAASLPFIPGGFPFPPVHGLSIDLSAVEIEALSNVECNARDICGLCFDERCPEIQDGFQGANYPYFLSPSFTTIRRNTSNGQVMEFEQDDGAQFVGTDDGVGTLTFHGDAADGFSGLYLQYPYSPWECRTVLTENIFSSFEFMINTLNPAGGYSEVTYGGWNSGPFGRIQFAGGSVTSSYINGLYSVPASISAGVWYTVEYKSSGADVMARIYPTGGAQTSWTTVSGVFSQFYPDQLSGNVDSFHLGGGYTQSGTPSNTEIKFRNVYIRRI